LWNNVPKFKAQRFMNLTGTVAVFGECMLELQGQPFGAMRQSMGGDTFNTAVYLARCAPGLDVAYATALGDDPLSAEMLRRWGDEGLRLDLVRTVPGRLPGLYLIELDAQGERRFHFWRERSAARSYFDPERTPLEAAGPQLDALYFSGISLSILDEAARERLFALAAGLRARGAQVLFDNNYRPRLWPSADAARTCFERAFALASTALVTLDDHQALFGLPDPAAALAHAQALPCAERVVKRGAQPTWVGTAQGEVFEQPTETVARVVDSTAAGDAFAGGYLSRRLRGADARSAAAFGNRVAARVIQHPGAVIPREAMEDLL
jgi:2-dehydro-3-deoxygluconokinase